MRSNPRMYDGRAADSPFQTPRAPRGPRSPFLVSTLLFPEESMKKVIASLAVLTVCAFLLIAFPAYAQHPTGGHPAPAGHPGPAARPAPVGPARPPVGGGHIPAH